MTYFTSRFRRVAAVVVVVGLCLAMDKPPQVIEGWGAVVDPDGDCKVQLQEGQLGIEVPDRWHDLSFEWDKMNAPRVLSDVEGDFRIQVKVRGEVHPVGTSTNPESTPFCGAGLLVWHDERNYIRLERASLVDGEWYRPYLNFEVRRDGRPVPAPPLSLGDLPVTLRIERRGQTITGWVSYDGAEWTKAGEREVTYPARIKIGVVAVSTSRRVFSPVFQGLRLDKPGDPIKPGDGPQPKPEKRKIP
jgi:regulation of enolase protein 1 (concanavalin A-like superfamily)